MARSNRRVFQLARLADCTVAQAISRLAAAGIPVASTNDLVPKALHDRAWKILGIDEVQRLRSQPVAGRASVEPVHEPIMESPVPRRDRPRPIIGHPTGDIAHLKAREVEEIHWLLVRDFAKTRDPIFPPGLKEPSLLESALFRAHTSLGTELKYPTIPMAAAAYLCAIIGDHAFHNGNKRTALVATLVFLDLNGFILEAEEDELFDYLLRIADHKILAPPTTEDLSDQEMWEVARWLHRHSRPISSGEQTLKFHELRSILNEYGCTFEHPKRGNRMNIFRGDHRTQVYFRNEGTDVQQNAIRKVRRDLHLLDEDGYDSTIFYRAAERVPDFIMKYRRTLDRLAKV